MIVWGPVDPTGELSDSLLISLATVVPSCISEPSSVYPPTPLWYLIATYDVSGKAGLYMYRRLFL